MRETLHGRPVRLQKDAAREPMLFDECSIGLGAPVADEHELGLPFSKPLLEASEVRCDLPAIPAVRAPVDEQDAFPPELLQRDLTAFEAREAERREGRRRQQTAEFHPSRSLVGPNARFERLDP